MEELGIDSLDEGTLVGSDDLVEYSAGEEDLEEETVYIKTEVSLEGPVQKGRSCKKDVLHFPS